MATQCGDVDPNVGFGPYLEKDSTGWNWKWGPWYGKGSDDVHTCLSMTESEYNDCKDNDIWTTSHNNWLTTLPSAVQTGIDLARQEAPDWDNR